VSSANGAGPETPSRDGYILLAPDKFKGSLPAHEVAECLAAGIAAFDNTIPLRELPVADGGDGTLAVAVFAGYTPVPVEVTGPLFDRVSSGFARLGAAAVIELADACGLSRLPPGVRAPLTASTTGVGDLVRAALDAGCREIVIGVGGSCSTDGGMGLAAALGARFLDERGAELPAGGASLSLIRRVDVDGLDPRLAEAHVIVASDVDNPLLGEAGAARVYGPQKGASYGDVLLLEAGLRNLVSVVARDLGVDPSGVPGAGAAGGVGYAAMALLAAEVLPGIGVLLDLLGFEAALRGARLVVIGEGSLDAQSMRGKAPIGVARAAVAAGVPVVAVAGQVSLDAEELSVLGIASASSLHDIEPDLTRCKREAAPLLEKLARGNTEGWLKIAAGDSGWLPVLHPSSQPAN
jgi:glycerate 2-kinase